MFGQMESGSWCHVVPVGKIYVTKTEVTGSDAEITSESVALGIMKT